MSVFTQIQSGKILDKLLSLGEFKTLEQKYNIPIYFLKEESGNYNFNLLGEGKKMNRDSAFQLINQLLIKLDERNCKNIVLYTCGEKEVIKIIINKDELEDIEENDYGYMEEMGGCLVRILED